MNVLHWWLLGSLACAMLLDIISGLIKAYNGKSEKGNTGYFVSSIMRKGGLIKCLVLLVSFAVDFIFSHHGIEYLPFAVYGYYIFCELASLNENLTALGVGLPDTILNFIDKLLKKWYEDDLKK